MMRVGGAERVRHMKSSASQPKDYLHTRYALPKAHLIALLLTCVSGSNISIDLINAMNFSLSGSGTGK